MRTQNVRAAALLVALATATAGAAAAATISSTTIDGQVVSHEVIRHVEILDSRVTNSSIGHAGISNTHVAHAHVFRASAEDSFFEHLTLEKVFVEDSRIHRATLRDASFEDATLCFALVDGPDYRVGDDCVLASTQDGNVVEHARLLTDAPADVAPNGSYSVEARFSESGTLVIRNDPAQINQFGFDTSAANSAVEAIQVWADGEMLCEVDLGEECDLQGHETFEAKVMIAKDGIVDDSTLGLVLDVNGHGLRTAMTNLDVVATQLAFAPMEAQPFAPFLADDVGRLVVSLPTDEFGNVDRDIDVAVTVDVLAVDSGFDEGAGPELGDVDHHASVHGDSELFSDEPFQYENPTSEAAHHPATLEMVLATKVGVPNIAYGSANYHATHLGAASPYYTTVELTASAVNANGETLEAAPMTIEMPSTPEEKRTVEVFGKEFTFPGRGLLVAHFVDANGDPVNSEPGWKLVITETPESHNVTMEVLIGDSNSEEWQPLAGSAVVPLPFGNFVASEYMVCLEHDGGLDCANDGGLVAIETGERTDVTIVLG